MWTESRFLRRSLFKKPKKVGLLGPDNDERPKVRWPTAMSENGVVHPSPSKILDLIAVPLPNGDDHVFFFFFFSIFYVCMQPFGL